MIIWLSHEEIYHLDIDNCDVSYSAWVAVHADYVYWEDGEDAQWSLSWACDVESL